MSKFSGNKEEQSKSSYERREGSLPLQPLINMTTRYKLYFAVTVSLLTFLVYLFSLKNGFVNWDDNAYIYENPYIHSLGYSFIRWAFFDFYAANWHPLTWISHALDYAIWGLNPLGHHLTNNILHAINTFIVVILITKLWEVRGKTSIRNVFEDNRTMLISAVVAGLLFGLHPLHVESVAWVSERKDLLCALFFMLSIMMYLKYSGVINYELAQKISKAEFFNKYYLLTIFFCILAMLSKPMAVSLPFVLLILDWYPLSRIGPVKSYVSAFVEKLPFLTLSLILSIVTIQAQKGGSALLSIKDIPLSSRVLVAFKSLVAYLWKMLIPVDLFPFYPYSSDIFLSSPHYFLPIAAVLCITVICVFMARPYKMLPAAWGYYVITLIPVLGVVQVGTQSMSDRYTYLPSLGPFLIIGLAVAWFVRKINNIGGIALKLFSAVIAVLFLIILASLTVKQIGIWKDGLTLWTYVIDKSSEKNALEYNYRSVAFADRGEFDKAIKDSNEAILLDPSYYDAYVNRGVIFGKAELFTEALQSLDKAIALNPNDSAAYVNRGIAYALIRQYDNALEDFNKAIEFNKQNAVNFTYLNRAKLYLRTGNIESAVADFRTACESDVEEACVTLHEIQATTKNPGVRYPPR